MPTLEAVAALYDNIVAMDTLFGDSIHLGHWPDGDDDSSLIEAQDRLTDLVSTQCGMPAGAFLLDVGCGTGGPARRLARAAMMSVTGGTISRKQAEKAGILAAQEGLADRVRFEVADVASLPLSDGAFDAVIAIESILHMPDKPQALREMFRVLRPGGVLTIADLTHNTPEAVTVETDAAAALLALFSAPDLAGCDELAGEAGFQVVDAIDLGSMTRLSWTRLLQRLDDRRPELTEAVGEQRVTAMEEVLRLYGGAAAAGTVGYALLTARKPLPI